MRVSLLRERAIVFAVILSGIGSGLLIPVFENGFAATSAGEEQVTSSTPLVKPDNATQQRFSEAYGKLPLSFEANNGQRDPRVKFISHAGGQTLFLTSTYALLKLGRSGQPEPAANKISSAEPDGQRTEASKTKPSVLRMKLLNANPASRVEGLQQLPSRSNYFIGNDPNKWRAGVSNYAKVQYRSVYPGIDMVYYGNQGRLEYDFKLAPGANPRKIRLAFDGVQRMLIDKKGDLVLTANDGEVRQHKPHAYQEVDGTRKEIACRYVLRERSEVSLSLERYDVTKPLLIDPVLTYSTYLGGNNEDAGNGIAVDASGNAYITGFTDSSDFPMASAVQSVYQGSLDVFVTKLNATGSALIYSTYLGGNNVDIANSIALDGQGNAYVTGRTQSSNFPTVNALQASNAGGLSDGFVTKLNSTGTAVVYSTYLGGNAIDDGQSIAADAGGSAYVTGRTTSTNFPTANALQASFNGVNDVFVSKLNSTGAALVYSSYLGGAGSEVLARIAIDPQGNAYVAGSTISPDFPTVNALQPVFKGKSIFRSSNAALSWADINNGLSPHFSVTTIAINPTLTSTVYAGTTLGKVFKSTDSGSSWTAVSTGQFSLVTINAIAVNPLNPTTLFVGAANGLLRSTDGGISWATTNVFNVSSIAFDPINTSNVYAGVRDFIAKSTDGGVTFSLIRVKPDNFFNNPGNLKGLAIDPSTPSTIYVGGSTYVFKSTDGGLSWSLSSNGLFFQPVTALVIDPATTSTLYAGTTFNVFKSTDGGGSWSRAGSNMSPQASALVIDPASTSTLYAGTDGKGLFKSTDGGNTWAEAREGLRNSFVLTLAIDPSNTAVLYSGNVAASDGFVSKLNQSGSALVYSTYLGGDDPDYCSSIAVDVSGNVFVAGQTYSANFPTVSSLQAHVTNTKDSFVSKLNVAGTALIYSTYIGGNGDDSANGIALDPGGNAYVAGSTDSSDFPLAGSLQPAPGDQFGDAFITKLNPSGTAIKYSTYFGARSTNEFSLDLGNAIAVDGNGNAFITGETLSGGLPTTPGAFQVTPRGIQPEAFVAKISDPPPFDLCLQDDSSGSILRINTTTGAYQFVSCGGLTLSGIAALNKRGCLITLQVNGPDRRLQASIDTCRSSGSASMQVFSQGRTFSIQDRNTANNTCVCAGG